MKKGGKRIKTIWKKEKERKRAIKLHNDKYKSDKTERTISRYRVEVSNKGLR
jgi:hypothetical protein